MNPRRGLFLPALVALSLALMAGGVSASLAQNEVSYMVLEGSFLVEDCTICERPSLLVPLRGTFRLAFREENPVFTTYDVQEIGIQSQGGVLMYEVTGEGEGTYEIGGEVAVTQRMRLKVQINDFTGIELESRFEVIQRVWPMMEIDVAQEPVDPLHVFSLHIIAAPIREIWVSTDTGFTSGTLKRSVSEGDLLSHSGRVVKGNLDLTGRLGIMPIVPDLGLDAIDIAPGGEVLFSIEEDAHSESLGHLQHGGLLSDQGRIVRANQQLTSAFGPEPQAPDVGLDAVQLMEDGEIFFSIEEDLFSETLGVMLRKGDLLSDKGVIIRTNEALLARFDPLEGQGDLGLDAVHVWPSGEIWFSTEIGFQSKTLGMISDGDILSTGDILTDRGSIISKNLPLLATFSPLEKLANFGLDALFLVIEESRAYPSVRETTIIVNEESGDVWIEWQSDGKVFQLERGDDPGGPYFPLAPITPEMTHVDPEASLGKDKSFYRIREW